MNRQSAITNVSISLSIPITGLLVALALMTPQKSWFILLLSSLIMIAIGKYSQFQNRKWVSFGSKHMEKPYKYFYLFGWFLLLIAIIISVAIRANA